MCIVVVYCVGFIFFRKFLRSCAFCVTNYFLLRRVPSWSWSHCEIETWSWRGVLDTTLCNKVCQWLATGRRFSPGTPVSSINKCYRHDITETLLKVALNTITLLSRRLKDITTNHSYGRLHNKNDKRKDEKFVDSKVVIRNRKSMDRQYNDIQCNGIQYYDKKKSNKRTKII